MELHRDPEHIVQVLNSLHKVELQKESYCRIRACLAAFIRALMLDEIRPHATSQVLLGANNAFVQEFQDVYDAFLVQFQQYFA